MPNLTTDTEIQTGHVGTVRRRGDIALALAEDIMASAEILDGANSVEDWLVQLKTLIDAVSTGDLVRQLAILSQLTQDLAAPKRPAYADVTAVSDAALLANTNGNLSVTQLAAETWNQVNLGGSVFAGHDVYARIPVAGEAPQYRLREHFVDRDDQFLSLNTWLYVGANSTHKFYVTPVPFTSDHGIDRLYVQQSDNAGHVGTSVFGGEMTEEAAYDSAAQVIEGGQGVRVVDDPDTQRVVIEVDGHADLPPLTILEIVPYSGVPNEPAATHGTAETFVRLKIQSTDGDRPVTDVSEWARQIYPAASEGSFLLAAALSTGGPDDDPTRVTLPHGYYTAELEYRLDIVGTVTDPAVRVRFIFDDGTTATENATLTDQNVGAGTHRITTQEFRLDAPTAMYFTVDVRRLASDTFDSGESATVVPLKITLTRRDLGGADPRLPDIAADGGDNDKLVGVIEHERRFGLTSPSTVVRAALGTRFPPAPTAPGGNRTVKANAAGTALDFGLAFVVTTQTAYDALTTKDPNTAYLIPRPSS